MLFRSDNNEKIGVEARRFRWAHETADLAKSAMLPGTDDSGWDEKLHGFGTQFYVLGPIPPNVGIYYFEKRLAALTSIDPSVPEYVYGRRFIWQPYDISWKLGKEGDPGHQGYHGLKRKVSDDFLCLGKQEPGLNEIRYVDEIPNGRYYVWTSATVPRDITADILFSDKLPDDNSHSSPVLNPAVIYVNGNQVSFTDNGINLKAGTNPVLVRFDSAGRGHFVLRQKDVPEPAGRNILSMRWSGDKGIIPFDITAGQTAAEWFRFLTAPGTSAITVRTPGDAEAWIDGVPMKKQPDGRFESEKAPQRAAVVAIRITPPGPGISGGDRKSVV